MMPRTVRGQAERKVELHVIDSVTGAPVEHAEVRVIKTVKDTAGWGTRLITDVGGRTVVHAPTNEQLLMTVRRLGFTASAVFVPPSDSDDVMFVALAPRAATLPATVTRADKSNRQLTEAGFYERRRINAGTFLDSAAVADRKPLDLMAVIRPYVKACSMIYVDGLPLLSLLDVDVRKVIGIEIYASNVESPPEFKNPLDSEHRCNTIVVWQRL